MNAIEIKNLHFSYGKENVLDGVSLCLKEGRLAILAGENLSLIHISEPTRP